MATDWKDRLGVVFSTNPDFKYETTEQEEPQTLPPGQQRLRVRFERAGRHGKTVTLVEGFVGRADDLKALCRLLKSGLGTGGSAKDGDIVIQGERVEQVKQLLRKAGYRV